MKDTQELKNGGVDRAHDPSLFQKSAFILLHLGILFFCFWLIALGGLNYVGGVSGVTLSFADPQRAWILFGCAFLYWLRHILTLFYLLMRKVGWSEVFGVIFFIASFEIGLLILGGGVFRSYAIEIGWLDALALFLLLFGSYLNSFSEIQRNWWKKDPTNKGHCYTQGLFRYSSHINFFGDTVLFTGWCLFTHNFLTLSLPLFMGAMFVFFHIPNLDLYLSKRYGDEFENYAKNTKKFVPFVY